MIFKEILPIVESRPSYGYKRVTAFVNKERALKGYPSLNKKRIFRLMKMNGLILPRIGEAVKREVRTGIAMTLKSNTRWCSDCFEIKCFNGEKVYVTFSMDTCDREILSWIAKKSPIQSEVIECLMIGAVENRFEVSKAPQFIEQSQHKIWQSNFP